MLGEETKQYVYSGADFLIIKIGTTQTILAKISLGLLWSFSWKHVLVKWLTLWCREPPWFICFLLLLFVELYVWRMTSFNNFFDTYKISLHPDVMNIVISLIIYDSSKLTFGFWRILRNWGKLRPLFQEQWMYEQTLMGW